MRKIIDGRKYDTDTARELAELKAYDSYGGVAMAFNEYENMHSTIRTVDQLLEDIQDLDRAVNQYQWANEKQGAFIRKVYERLGIFQDEEEDEGVNVDECFNKELSELDSRLSYFEGTSQKAIARLHDLRDTFTEDTGQTVYSSMMKPCPFCGGKAWIQTSNVFDGGWETRAVCSECHVSTSREWEGGKVTYIPTGEDITRLLAIEKTVKVWNRRV